MNSADRLLRRLLGNNIVFIDTKGRAQKRIVRDIKPATALQQDRARALQGCDVAIILNELPYEDALAIFEKAQMQESDEDYDSEIDLSDPQAMAAFFESKP